MSGLDKKNMPSPVQRSNAFGNDRTAAYTEFMRLRHLIKTLETELGNPRLGLMARKRKKQLIEKTIGKASLLAGIVANMYALPPVKNTRQRTSFWG
jgi:hypothetical protein